MAERDINQTSEKAGEFEVTELDDRALEGAAGGNEDPFGGSDGLTNNCNCTNNCISPAGTGKETS